MMFAMAEMEVGREPGLSRLDLHPEVERVGRGPVRCVGQRTSSVARSRTNQPPTASPSQPSPITRVDRHVSAPDCFGCRSIDPRELGVVGVVPVTVEHDLRACRLDRVAISERTSSVRTWSSAGSGRAERSSPPERRE